MDARLSHPMNTNSTPKASGSGAADDLARFCFEPDVIEANRRLAWVNSICLVYLIIGLIGIKPRAVVVRKPAGPADEAVATIIEPATLPVIPPAAADPATEPASGQPAAGGAAIVAVTLDSPAVVFSVPTAGNVLVPLGLAAAPPANPMTSLAPPHSATIATTGPTGTTGSRPAPAYPAESLRAHEQGTVVLLIEVAENGQASSVRVKESSGYRRLDQAAIEVVQRFWYFGQATGQRMYESPIVFRLQ